MVPTVPSPDKPHSPAPPGRPSTATPHGSFRPLTVPTHRQQLHELSQDNDRLRAERDHLHRQLQQAVVLDTDQLARFAATAQAEGVSLPVARRLLLPLLQQRTPSVPQLGRWTRMRRLHKADALLSVLDAVARPRVEQVAADEIFFGRRPCLMVVEQHSLCWLTGRLADNRDGDTWAEEFRRLPNLKQVTRDGDSRLHPLGRRLQHRQQRIISSPRSRRCSNGASPNALRDYLL